VIWPGNDSPAVCVLDTGINRGHALIEPALGVNDSFAIDADWGVEDHDPDGHGTATAGLALHGDLTAVLSDTEDRWLLHRLESVKFCRRLASTHRTSELRNSDTSGIGSS